MKRPTKKKIQEMYELKKQAAEIYKQWGEIEAYMVENDIKSIGDFILIDKFEDKNLQWKNVAVTRYELKKIS